MANAHSNEIVFLLWVCIFEKTDTLTLAGVFTSKKLAMEADKHFNKYRTIIEERQLNSLEVSIP